MSNAHLALHALQTLPPSNVNRDDFGSPKSAVFGGVPRARVSSQSWKRAMRTHFTTAGLVPAQDLSVRTRQGIGLLAAAVTERLPGLDPKTAAQIAEAVLVCAASVKADPGAGRTIAGIQAPGTRETLLLGTRQIAALADIAAQGAADIKAHLKVKTTAAALRAAAASANAVDIALFGRMVAAVDDLDTDAAVQVAHALAVHHTPVETDFFSAVDDLATGSGAAGLIGRREFLSPTLYRYAVLDGKGLAANLADYAGTMSLQQVAAAFIRSFAESIPSGSITSYAHTTRPTVLIATVTSNPLSYINAFETPVETTTGGHLPAAAERLADHRATVEAAYGDPAAQSFLLTLDPKATEPLHTTAQRADSATALADHAATALTRRMDQLTALEAA